jgi:peptide/nickel transport system substrate-binding protein
VAQVSHQDQEKAKELLKQVGYNGEPVKLLTTEAYPEFHNAALVLKQQLEAVGVTVDFQSLDWGTMLSLLGDPTAYDLFPMNYPNTYTPASIMYVMNSANGGDDQFQEYVDEMQAKVSVEEAQEFWKTTVMPYAAEQVFQVHIGFYDYVYGASDKVPDFDTSFGLTVWNYRAAE